MKIEKTINYTLSINEPEGHGVYYENTLENDIAGLMIGLQVMETNLSMLKEAKKTAKGAEKKAISTQINVISQTIRGMNGLVMNICENYEHYKLSAEAQKKKELIKEINKETPPLTERQKDTLTNL